MPSCKKRLNWKIHVVPLLVLKKILSRSRLKMAMFGVKLVTASTRWLLNWVRIIKCHVLALCTHYWFHSPHRAARFCSGKRPNIGSDCTEAVKGSQDILVFNALKLPVVLGYSGLGALGKPGSTGMFPRAAMGRKVSKELQHYCAVHRVDSSFNFFTRKIVRWVFGSPF